jgi:hypothetical protein
VPCVRRRTHRHYFSPTYRHMYVCTLLMIMTRNNGATKCRRPEQPCRGMEILKTRLTTPQSETIQGCLLDQTRLAEVPVCARDVDLASSIKFRQAIGMLPLHLRQSCKLPKICGSGRVVCVRRVPQPTPRARKCSNFNVIVACVPLVSWHLADHCA